MFAQVQTTFKCYWRRVYVGLYANNYLEVNTRKILKIPHLAHIVSLFRWNRTKYSN